MPTLWGVNLDLLSSNSSSSEPNSKSANLFMSWPQFFRFFLLACCCDVACACQHINCARAGSEEGGGGVKRAGERGRERESASQQVAG